MNPGSPDFDSDAAATPQEESPPLFTIGYGARTLDEFLAVLKANLLAQLEAAAGRARAASAPATSGTAPGQRLNSGKLILLLKDSLRVVLLSLGLDLSFAAAAQRKAAASRCTQTRRLLPALSGRTTRLRHPDRSACLDSYRPAITPLRSHKYQAKSRP